MITAYNKVQDYFDKGGEEISPEALAALLSLRYNSVTNACFALFKIGFLTRKAVGKSYYYSKA
jgi:hypothetical protein